jgi:N-hydroxyarylamine O-acetyltransferase
MKFSADQYLARLEVNKEKPSISFLRVLHKNHLTHIPFENLDFHYGKRVILDLDKIYEKVIPTIRGGYCFELNLLFWRLLTDLGFECHLLSGQDLEQSGKQKDLFSRMMILVIVDESSFLADVGMIEGFHYPLKLINNQAQLDYTRFFKLVSDEEGNWILQKSGDMVSYKPICKFTLEAKKSIEFLDQNDWYQDHADSELTKGKIIGILTQRGSIKLTDRILTIKLEGEEKEIEITNEDAFLSNLEQYFQINIDDLMDQSSKA